jgi:WD40 repeat protein
MTDFQKRSGTPRWSPDSTRIVFDSVEAGDWNLYIMDADGRVTRRLTPETSADYRGAWSPDGRWIYFVSNRGGSTEIWKMPSAGGPASQVTRGGAVYAQASWDGRYVYYAKSEYGTGIWRLPVAGGEESEVVRGPIPHAFDWALGRAHLVYATKEREYAIHSLDLATGETVDLFRKAGPLPQGSLAVSPDEEWILYGEGGGRGTWELKLIENFR